MANREERRAAEKRRRRGEEESQYQEKDRVVSGSLDPQSLNNKSVHLQERKSGQWTPSSNVQRQDEEDEDEVPSANPSLPEPDRLSKGGKRKNRDRDARAQARLQAVREEELRRRRQSSKNAHPISWWLRVIDWGVIILAAIAFVALIWLPFGDSAKLISVVVITIFFCLGVFNLFFLGRSSKENPNLDEYGTAI